MYRHARWAARVGLAVNLSLAVVKLFAGIAGDSIAMIADAVNSTGDVLTSCVILYALKVAQGPADDEHPYGHSRAEVVAALSVAILIAVSALAVGLEAIRNLTTAHSVPPAYVLWIAGANVAIKESIYRYKRRVARQTGSQAIAAGAWDHRSDAMCSAAVLVGLAVVRYGGQAYAWADEAAALAVVGFILVASIRLYRESASLLMDERCDPSLTERIRQVASQAEGVQTVEQVRSRRSGIEVFVDIHIEVGGSLTVAEGHRIGHEVQRRIIEQVTPVSQVLVHVEPERGERQAGRAWSDGFAHERRRNENGR